MRNGTQTQKIVRTAARNLRSGCEGTTAEFVAMSFATAAPKTAFLCLGTAGLHECAINALRWRWATSAISLNSAGGGESKQRETRRSDFELIKALVAVRWASFYGAPPER